MAQSARKELHTDDLPPVEQRPDIDGENIVKADAGDLDRARLDELKFNEEPVTIRLEPSTDENAALHFPCWVNGRGAEVWNESTRQWIAFGYLPVGRTLIVKRKYVEVLLRAKIDRIRTVEDKDQNSEFVANRERRSTSAVHALSILEDRNPMGAAWASDIRRRNM